MVSVRNRKSKKLASLRSERHPLFLEPDFEQDVEEKQRQALCVY